MKTEYKIIMEYARYEEYEVTFDEDGNHIAGNIWDSYERQEPKYLVKEVHKMPDGYYEELDCLEEFDTYQEALDFIKTFEERRGANENAE